MKKLEITPISDDDTRVVSYDFVQPDGSHVEVNANPVANVPVTAESAAIVKHKLNAVRRYRKLVNAEVQNEVSRKKRTAASRKRAKIQKASRRQNRGR
jgi:hypothetical protein